MREARLSAEPTVYRHYTKAELDRNFDQRGWARNAEEVIARYVARSRATRARLDHRRNVRYGPSADETLDIFYAPRSPAPVQVFVHGGAWRHFTKDDYSFVADSFVPAGIHTVVLSFANLPTVRLPDMLAQVRRGFAWVCRHAESFGGDPSRVYACAHSSGAHLTALALAADPAAQGLDDGCVQAATLLSGPYDMEPVMLSARSAYVRLTAYEVAALSPLAHADAIRCPIVIASADGDTDEFKRQSDAFAAALGRAGRLAGRIVLTGMNHFEGMEAFGDPDGPLTAAILNQMGVARPPAAGYAV